MKFIEKYNDLIMRLVNLNLTDAEIDELFNQYKNFKDDHIEWYNHINESCKNDDLEPYIAPEDLYDNLDDYIDDYLDNEMNWEDYDD